MGFSSLIPKAPRLKKFMVGGTAVVLFYTVIGFFVLPLFIRTIAIKQLSKHFARAVAIQSVRLNPYTFSASARGLSIQDKDGEPLASWDEIAINFQLTSLFKRAWTFKQVTISRPFLRVQINKDYTLNVSDILAMLSVWKTTEPGSTRKPRPWHIDLLHITAGKVAFSDLTTRSPFRKTVDSLELTATNFQTDAGHRNQFAISCDSGGGEQFGLKAWLGFSPLRSEGEISVNGFALTSYAALYQDLFRFEITDGVIALRSNYRFEQQSALNVLAVTNLNFELKSLQLVEKETHRPAAKVSSLMVAGASLDALARQAEANTVTLSGAQFSLRRNKDTSVNAVELLKPAESAPGAPGGVLILLRAMTNLVALLLNTTNVATGVIRDLTVTNCELHLLDLVNSQPVRLDLEDIAIRASNLSNRAGSNMTAQLSLRWDTNGTVRAGVTAGLAPPNAEVGLALRKLSLMPLAPYLEPYLDVFVLGSRVNLEGTARLRSAKDALPEVRFQGDAWLEDFSLAEGIATEGLLRWDSLRLSGIEANLNPPEISATNATLSNVFARLIIETNRTINLLSALRRGGTNVPVALSSTNFAAVYPRISLASLVVSNANVHFIDRSLRPNVNINLQELNGSVSRLSSDDPQQADVQLQGTVDNTARAEIKGKMNPWNSRQEVELKVSLHNMDLLPEAPYASKYLGYRLVKGNLSAQLHYEITERKVKSKNRLTLDQLTLGDKVESPEATKLPVRLAIALLKDRDGRISLDLPVSGSLDDPEFSMGGVVYRALQTVLTKIVTSPFSALASLFRGNSEGMNYQEFEPGSTALLPTASAKLDALAEAIYQRPELQLRIEGSVDPVADLAALRRERLNQQLTIPGDPSADAVPVAPRLPAAHYRKTASFDKGASALRSSVAFWSANPDSIKRGAVHSLQTHSQPFVDERGATALMLVPTPIPPGVAQSSERKPVIEIAPDALDNLALQRAKAVKDYLVRTGKVEAQRINDTSKTAALKGSRVNLSLE